MRKYFVKFADAKKFENVNEKEFLNLQEMGYFYDSVKSSSVMNDEVFMELDFTKHFV